MLRLELHSVDNVKAFNPFQKNFSVKNFLCRIIIRCHRKLNKKISKNFFLLIIYDINQKKIDLTEIFKKF